MWRIKKIYFIPPFILQNIFIWIPARILFRVFLRLDIIGRENLKGVESPVIFAVNHSSELDPILLTDSFPWFSRFIPMFYISDVKETFKSKETFGWKSFIYGGIFFNALGAYPVYKGVGDYEKSLKNHIEILNDGGSLTIYPEGRRFKNPDPQRARPGLGYLLLKTEKPVVPVYIDGAYNTKIFDFLTFKRKAKVVFGKPIYAHQFKNRSYDKENLFKVSRFVMEQVIKLKRKHA